MRQCGHFGAIIHEVSIYMPRVLRRKHVQDTFEVNKTSLQSILSDVRDGHLQLPNLQRSWRWPDENIVALLESIAINHPVGAIMQIETGGELRFQYRGIEGTDEDISERVSPTHLLLDGQQRCTSLFQACFARGPVKVEAEKRARYHRYFFDMAKVLYEDVPMSEAIISLVVDWRGIPIRKDIPDYTVPEVQYERMIFPVNEMFEFHEWDDRFHAYWDAKDVDRATSSEASKTAREFHAVIVRAFTTCMVPVIMLKRGMDVAGVCKVYENLNSRGIALDAFDLLIAHFAAQGYCLRTDWYGPRGKTGTKAEIEAASLGIIDDIDPKQFMQAVILAHGLGQGIGTGIEKDDLLSLKLETYLANRDAVIRGFAAASDFLREQHVHSAKTAPTMLYIVCIAAMFAHLGEKGDDPDVRSKLARWLWTSALCLSFAAHSTRTMAEAVPEVVGWLEGTGPEPSTIVNPIITYGDIKGAKKGGNVHKALTTAILRAGARDPASGLRLDPADLEGKEADEVQLFPSAWCKENGIDPEMSDSIVNRVLVSPPYRRLIGKAAPSVALASIEGVSGPDHPASRNLLTQGIDMANLLADDFAGYFDQRVRALATLVENITGSRVISDDDILALQARAKLDDTAPTEYTPEGFLWRTVARGANVFLGAADGQYVVLAGSVMAADATPSLDERFVNERERLISEGVLRQEEDDSWLLTEDYPSRSASHAYSVFVGQKAVGRIWRDRDGNICVPVLPGTADADTGRDGDADQASGLSGNTDGPAVGPEDGAENGDDRIWSFVTTVEEILGEPLVPVGRNLFHLSDGRTLRFSKTFTYPNADYEGVSIRPQHLESDFIVIWSRSGRAWMIPSSKVRDFVECVPPSSRSSGSISWDPRVGTIDGQEQMWTNYAEYGGLPISTYSLTE
jgi:hypothetical protein